MLGQIWLPFDVDTFLNLDFLIRHVSVHMIRSIQVGFSLADLWFAQLVGLL